MRTIAVISKPQKPDLAPVLTELMLWMQARGIEPMLDPVSGNYVQSPHVVPRHEMAEHNPELAIVLGGDGTLLAAARAQPPLDRIVLHAATAAALPERHPARHKVAAANEPAAFVCIGDTCSLPVGDPDGLIGAIEAARHA